MNYDDFQRHIGKAGPKRHELATLMDMSHLFPAVSAEALATLECAAISLGEKYSLSPSALKFSPADPSSGQWQLLFSLLFVSLAVEDDTLMRFPVKNRPIQ
ncbi:hypothetical protein O0880_10555 [Janthinobacterium sp. SUN118]|uniref:hypothetical protein n=1 Tax=Janthinobacterium sp. SUN118 TaxID=3004100 RepID=UPI0025AF01D1|nr:hypothetical protein [Janthinobacterium sp. SUN118]MDN2709854.1 hypothetical protein [Janthinobacterium sp. SUN118]